MAGITKDGFWDKDFSEVISDLKTQENGLSQEEAQKRIKINGANVLAKKRLNAFHILIRQVKSNPLIIILAIATFISYLLGEHISSYYIFGLIILSIVLGFWNEYSAARTVERLLKQISQTTLIERGGEKIEVDVSAITIGDIVYLSEGTIIPADLRLIETDDLEINEASLTGESIASHKFTQKLDTEPQGLHDLKNIAFMGTAVESGSGKGVVIRLARDTEFGKIERSLTFIKPETDFEKGLTGFGKLLVNIILIMTLIIFVVNTLIGHKLIDSLLFSLAIAVGLTPELLPVIVTVSLSHGAGKLSKKHVIAKQLISIENLGNMDILCTDKTGTLTEGKINVVNITNENGEEDKGVLKYALICNDSIMHHKRIGNAIDISLWEYAMKENINLDKSIEKIYDVPFDFNKKAMYTVAIEGESTYLIAKGAPLSIISSCSNIDNKDELIKKFEELGAQGLRVIAIAKRDIEKKEKYTWDDVSNLQFIGHIAFLDIPKASAKGALEKLHKLNVHVKVVTGDNEIVTKKICSEVGMDVIGIILGSDIDSLSEDEFKKALENNNVFARVNPEQKLRIITTLQSMGHTVGFMGDGINDSPSLHAADVGISVNTAVDVAKESASIVLIRKGLDIITEGIVEGRRTFNNTIKYILMGTSSNFGNMFSAAGASFFLPFLPMTPAQILLTNGLYDISQLSIPTDNVDPESLLKPRHWNIQFIRNYMLFFGPISSLYDFITFIILLFVFHATGSLFQSGWFIESIATEILVVFVIRTARVPFFLSRASNWLLGTCTSLTLIGVILPFTIFGKHLGLVVPPATFFLFLIGIIVTYLSLVEFSKRIFLKKFYL